MRNVLFSMALVLGRIILTIFQVDEVGDLSDGVDVQFVCCGNWLQVHSGKLRGYMK